MIIKKVIPLTIYNTICAECNAEGPTALSEEDAHSFAVKKGWTLFEEDDMQFYICPSRIHEKFRALYTLRKYVEGLKEERDNAAVSANGG